MVKKSRTTNPSKNVGGRPARDPDTLRTERLVLRVHPDLMAELTALAARNGISRSMMIERTMISLVNLESGDPRMVLDFAGRRLDHTEPSPSGPLGSPESFNQIWQKMIGGAPAQRPMTPQPPPGTPLGRGERS